MDKSTITVRRDIAKEALTVLFGGEVTGLIPSDDGTAVAVVETPRQIHILNTVETALLRALLELDSARDAEMAVTIRTYEGLLATATDANFSLRTALEKTKGDAGTAISTGLDLVLENAKLRSLADGYARTIKHQSESASKHGQEIADLLTAWEKDKAELNSMMTGLSVAIKELKDVNAAQASRLESNEYVIADLTVKRQNLEMARENLAKNNENLRAENTKFGKALAEKNALDEGDRVAKAVFDRTCARLSQAELTQVALEKALAVKTDALIGYEQRALRAEDFLNVETSFRKEAERTVRSLRAKLAHAKRKK